MGKKLFLLVYGIVLPTLVLSACNNEENIRNDPMKKPIPGQHHYDKDLDLDPNNPDKTE